MSKIIVAKFGGTSMADADAIKQSAQVALDNAASIVIVSATSGTTDELNNLAGGLTKKPSIESLKIIEQLKIKHQKIASNLKLAETRRDNLDKLFSELNRLALSLIAEDNSAVLKEIYPSTRQVYKQRLKEIPNVLEINPLHPLAKIGKKTRNKQVYDRILSFGERASAIFMVDTLAKLGLDSETIDARRIIKTDDHHTQASPLLDKIKVQAEKIIMPKLLEGKVIVSQGFIGRALDGSTTTLGRGGSDYSAALFAEAIGAHQLQIWSDVAGIATSDPRIVKNTSRVSEITFQEASELATAGAKILHSRCISPMRRANIPIFVGNTFSSKEGGTTILRTTKNNPIVRAIAISKDETILRITTAKMAEQYGYMARLFEVFSKHKVNLDQVSTSEISVAVAVDKTAKENSSLMKGLESLGRVTLEEDVNAISLIGNNINSTPGLIKDIFTALESDGDKISIRMICQGASKHNICFFVLKSEGNRALQKLHKEFIEK